MLSSHQILNLSDDNNCHSLSGNNNNNNNSSTHNNNNDNSMQQSMHRNFPSNEMSNGMNSSN